MGDSDWGRWQVIIGFISLIVAFVGLFYQIMIKKRLVFNQKLQPKNL